ncbi:MAG: porin family protein [Hydrogenophaga sp.]|jgi:opacity protein-like surface antigen|nr:porin family protein [Hydrogenophaga sp.]
MTRIAKISATLGLALLAAGAQAQSLYGEVGYTGLEYKAPGLKASPGMVRGVVGYDIMPNVAVEGMVGLNGGSDTSSGTTLKLSNMVGVFGKVQAPLTDALKVYGRLGVARTSLKANGMSDHETGLAYGAGVTYDLSQTTYLNADYTSYYDRDSKKLDGFTVGVGFRF